MAIRASRYEPSISIPQCSLSDYGKKSQGLGSYGIHEYTTETQSFAIKKLYSEDYISSSMEREVAIMRRLKHPHILPLIDVVANDQKKNLYIVLPLAQHDLKSAHDLSDTLKKKYAYQALLAVAYCHSRDILHLDIKPQNFLVFEDGLKLADFGLSLSSNRVTNYNLIKEVQTRWYRSPELLLGGNYKRSDDWAVGCVLYELYTGTPLFPGDSVIDQLFRIFRTFGTPTSESWPGVQDLPEWKSDFPTWKKDKWSTLTQKLPPEIEAITHSLLQMDPSKRCTVFDALKHPYFDDIREDESSIVPYSCLETLDMRDAYLTYGRMAIVIAERSKAFDHMRMVCRDYDVSMRSYFLAIHLFDDTNLILQLQDDQLYLLASACLWIASIFLERYDIDSADLINASNSLFTVNELTDMQLRVLKTLSYDLCRSTSYDFLLELQREYSNKTVQTASDVLCLLMSTHLPFKYTASEIAIAGLYVGCLRHHDDFLHSSKYTSQVDSIVEYVSEIRDPLLAGIFEEKEIHSKIQELSVIS